MVTSPAGGIVSGKERRVKTMTVKQYENLGPGQKGERDGQPYALYLDPSHGTVYGPVMLLGKHNHMKAKVVHSVSIHYTTNVVYVGRFNIETLEAESRRYQPSDGRLDELFEIIADWRLTFFRDGVYASRLHQLLEARDGT